MNTLQSREESAGESKIEYGAVLAESGSETDKNGGLAGKLEISLDRMKKAVPFLPFGVITIVALLVAYYYYNEANGLRANPQAAAQNEVAQVIARVGELIVLPEGEQPTIATVTDPEPLKNQPFFAKTKVGDRVLIYTTARKAILYDPVRHKIVEVAPLNIGNAGQ